MLHLFCQRILSVEDIAGYNLHRVLMSHVYVSWLYNNINRYCWLTGGHLTFYVYHFLASPLQYDLVCSSHSFECVSLRLLLNNVVKSKLLGLKSSALCLFAEIKRGSVVYHLSYLLCPTSVYLSILVGVWAVLLELSHRKVLFWLRELEFCW